MARGSFPCATVAELNGGDGTGRAAQCVPEGGKCKFFIPSTLGRPTVRENEAMNSRLGLVLITLACLQASCTEVALQPSSPTVSAPTPTGRPSGIALQPLSPTTLMSTPIGNPSVIPTTEIPITTHPMLTLQDESDVVETMVDGNVAWVSWIDDTHFTYA
jgi:hypothetical protein